jgi:ABC-type phosphate transport system substrate-binding protein
MTKIHSRILVLSLAMTLSLAAHAASWKLVANNSVSTTTLSKKQVGDLFLKKTAKWDSGAAVVPVDQIDASTAREAFSKAVHGKTAAAVKSYWNQQIFSGRDVPPVEKRTDNEVLSFVRSTPGAIGYVSDGTPTDGVRVIAVN